MEVKILNGVGKREEKQTIPMPDIGTYTKDPTMAMIKRRSNPEKESTA